MAGILRHGYEGPAVGSCMSSAREPASWHGGPREGEVLAPWLGGEPRRGREERLFCVLLFLIDDYPNTGGQRAGCEEGGEEG